MRAPLVCPKTGKLLSPGPGAWWAALMFPVIGLVSLVWFLVRVIPKPSRASYPCMRVAAPLASSFVMWLVGLTGSAIALRKARQRIGRSRYVVATVCVGVAVAAASLGVIGPRAPWAWFKSLVDPIPPDPVNEPIGVARGYNPGRVAWVHDADATDWDGIGHGQSWAPAHTDQAVADTMMSRALRWLTGKSTDAAAWRALLRHFNSRRGKGIVGYSSGEKIGIKVNFAICQAQYSGIDPETHERPASTYGSDTSPQMIMALLRQLVNVVGAAQSDIAVGDPGSYFPQEWYDYLAPEFPNVHYLDHYAFAGRTAVQYSSTEFHWSTPDAAGKLQDHLPVSFAEAAYIINLAELKGHSSGITVCGKNHYGSLIRNPDGYEWGELKNYYDMHPSLPNPGYTPGRGLYRGIVDPMGHEELGGKTVLYLIDGLYGGYYADGQPFEWAMAPFNGDWPSSLFASQDPVAIDSVAYDFLEEEWPDVVSGGVYWPDALEGGAQDYLHEAALADDPPSETTYDPENDGSPLASQGVHEHWNNATNKQYTRNLGTGDGIELVSGEPEPSLDLLVRTEPVKGIPIAGVPAGCGGDTDYMLQLDDGTEVTLTAPDSWDDGRATYHFVRWRLDEEYQPVGQRELGFTLNRDTAAVAFYEEGVPSVHVEHGVAGVTHNWKQVNFQEAFSATPVVVAGPAGRNDSRPGVVRVKKVTRSGFKIRFQEWDYLDGKHKKERVHWVAVERGQQELARGGTLVAGTFRTNRTKVSKPKEVGFAYSFAARPVVLAQVQSCADKKAVTDRICNVTQTRFSLVLQQQEKAGGQKKETVGYIAISDGVTQIGTASCETGRTAANVTHKGRTINTALGSCKVFCEEEKSKDAETRHRGERVGYIALGGTPPLVADMQTCNERDTAVVRCCQKVSTPTGYELEMSNSP